MNRRTQVLTLSRAAAEDLAETLGDNVPVAVLWNAAEIRLYTGPMDVNPDSDHTLWTEATFDGYAPIVEGIADTGNAPGGRQALDQAIFVGGAALADPGQEITGYAIVLNGPPEVLLAAEAFAEPVQFTAPGDYLELDIVIEIPYALVVSDAA